MKKTLKVAGIIVLAAGALYYPALQLYKYMAKKKKEEKDIEEVDGEQHFSKAFVPAYRGKHKPHHRHNGHSDNN